MPAGSIGASGTIGCSRDARLKSNMSSIGSAAASRRVSGGTPQRVSMNFKIDVWSYTTCDTWCGFEYGDITNAGTRTPYRLNALNGSPGGTIGGMSSGGTAAGGA